MSDIQALISDAEAQSIRQALAIVLVHSYTRTPTHAGAEDAHFNATTVPGDPVPGQPCRYEASTRVRTDEGGTSFVYRPTLEVPADDPLKTGDLVADVRNAQNVMLLAGPLTVGRLLSDDPLGVTLQKSFELRGAETGQG